MIIFMLFFSHNRDNFLVDLAIIIVLCVVFDYIVEKAYIT